MSLLEYKRHLRRREELVQLLSATLNKDLFEQALVEYRDLEDAVDQLVNSSSRSSITGRKVRLHDALVDEQAFGSGSDERELERKLRFDEIAQEVLKANPARLQSLEEWWRVYQTLDHETRERRDRWLFGVIS